MKCPKCNIELNKGICLKCGYMENGNQIEQFKKHDKYTNIRIYNEDFDQMNQNLNKGIVFVLGPFYFSYRNHLLIGLIIGIIDILLLMLVYNIVNALTSLGSIYNLYAFFIVVFYPIINRVLYMSFSNSICILLDTYKVKRISNMDTLVNHRSKSFIKIFIHILLYMVILGFILKI